MAAVVGAVALGAIFASLPRTESAQSALINGRFVSVCGFSHESSNDPIVFPRQPGLAHLHHFFGNESTNARSTPRKLRRRIETTCDPTDDRSGYWVPALEVSGKVIEPSAVRAYYSSRGKNPSTVQPPPKGLEVIAGDAKALGPQPVWMVAWNCVSSALSDVVSGSVEIPYCPPGSQLVLSIVFPDCWNGVDLDSDDHTSHMAYATPPSLTRPWSVCPATHPVPVPALNLKVIYPTRGAFAGSTLSSGSEYSGHADFMNGWSQGALDALVRNCIQHASDCRQL